MKENEVKGIAATAKAVEDFYRSHSINLSARFFDIKDELDVVRESAAERDDSIRILNLRIQELERENTDLKEENGKMLTALNSGAQTGYIKEELD